MELQSDDDEEVDEEKMELRIVYRTNSTMAWHFCSDGMSASSSYSHRMSSTQHAGDGVNKRIYTKRLEQR